VSCEVDRDVLLMAALNPWSQGYFSTEGLEIRCVDVEDFVASAGNQSFGCIFHDPPTIYVAGELYSGELYRHFARILRPGGVLYHYVGTPGARHGQDYAAGVMRRLREGGFAGLRRVTGGVLGRLPRR
jgi:predicted methyltransferase